MTDVENPEQYIVKADSSRISKVEPLARVLTISRSFLVNRRDNNGKIDNGKTS